MKITISGFFEVVFAEKFFKVKLKGRILFEDGIFKALILVVSMIEKMCNFCGKKIEY